MTPADLAMKAALDESVRYADSPLALAPAANPLLGRPPHPKVTSLESHAGNFAGPVDIESRPNTPHVTLHQFHKLQYSPVSSSPDIDYKRVRRKQSFASLIRPSPDSSRLPAQFTSSSTSPHSKPSQSLLPPLLPPLPLTPLHRPRTYSPSLSSTVDTLQSTPTHTPIQRVFWPPAEWSDIEPGGLSKPLRTKRKFLPLKQAKRLPHDSAYQTKEESVWEVHAVVIDVGLGIGGLNEFDGEDAPQAGGSRSVGAASKSPKVGDEGEPDRRRDRLVRFEGFDSEESSSGAEVPAWPLPDPGEKRPKLTSSLSLSRFTFPVPPGRNWEGTFGHLTEARSPTSPATVHYKGTSFDVVNPHTSLLLGVSDIETPAEIDGLLDNYFDSDTFDIMAYNGQTGGRSTSQASFQTSASNGRQRVLYDDPDSARRNIMGIDRGDSEQTIIHSPFHGQESTIPPMPTYAPPSTPSLAFRPRPATPNPFSFLVPDQPRGLQIHPSLREVLGLGAAGSSRVVGDDVDYQDLEDGSTEEQYPAVSTQESHCSPALAEAGSSYQIDDRPSSIYPHSRRSYPFDLSLSDDEEDRMYSNVNDVVASRRTSRRASTRDRGGGFAIYEDAEAGDANARTGTSLEPETTVGNILSHYDYPRPTLGTMDYYDSPYEDASTQSASIGLVRGEGPATNPFLSPEDHNPYYADTRMLQDPVNTFPNVPRERLRGDHRVPGPPQVPAPAAPFYVRNGPRRQRYTADLIEPYSTDQTYGSTGQLLGLTPQVERRRQRMDPGFEEVPTTPANIRPTPVPPPIDDGDEDKENTPPHRERSPSTLSVTPRAEAEATYYEGPRRVVGPATIVNLPALLQRSTSATRDDESIWESTQASQSRENLATLAEDPMEYEDHGGVRPSEDSYANTSIAGVRLSLPRAGIEIPRLPAAVRRAWPAMVAGASAGLAAREGAFMPVPASRWNHDEERARRILEAKMIEDAMPGESYQTTQSRSQEQYQADMRELEDLRRTNPSAVERACQTVSLKFGTLVRFQSTPTPEACASSFPRFWFGRNTPDSRHAETRGLLAERTGSPVSRGGLRYSETANTFRTTRMPSFLTHAPVQNYSPLTPPPIAQPPSAHLRDLALRDLINSPAPRVVGHRPCPVPPGSMESIELRPMPHRGRISRVAMSSQTELRPLQLADSTAASGISRPLTDQQLAEASGGWTMRPRTSHANHLSTLRRGHSFATALDIYDSHPNLLSAREGRNVMLRHAQRELTRRYFQVFVLTPISALIFGLGGMDWRMRQISHRRINEMSPTAKRRALLVFFPLGFIFYLVVGLTIALLVVATNRPD